MIKLDISKEIGTIPPLHAVGQPPMLGAGFDKFKPFHYLTDANIPYSRLHDVGGAFGAGKYVDIPNIFRNFDGDENDPESYDFAHTDALISALVNAGVEPYFRLGITIESDSEIKPYYTYPPKDYEKWARICEHIIMHYNEGWANGFRYGIKYWEIWNEPDGGSYDGSFTPPMWNGTMEEFFRLYEIASKHLKSRFPSIKVGGYAAIGFSAITDTEEELRAKPRHTYQMDFFYGFLDHVKKTSAPLDFFSWHNYLTPEKCIKQARWLRCELNKLGFSDTESHLNEWNTNYKERGSAKHAADMAAVILALSDGSLDLACFYDARLQGSIYAGLFNPMTYTPFAAYYTLCAYGILYQLRTRVYTECDTNGLYTLAASNKNRSALMIANISSEEKPIEIIGADLTEARWYVIDEYRLLSWSPKINSIPNNSVVLVDF